MPSLDAARRRTRILLAGEPPSPSDPPSGCVFRTRCPWAIAACAADVPALRDAGPGHQAACIRSGELDDPAVTASLISTAPGDHP